MAYSVKLLPKWALVRKDESEAEAEQLLQDESFPILRKGSYRYVSISLLAVNIIILIVNICLFSHTRFAFHSLPKTALKNMNTFSPILDEMDFSFREITMNGSLNNDPWSIYRAQPSQEVDSAWEKIAIVQYFPITEESVRRLGKDPKRSLRVPTSWGLCT
ncbi:DUF3328 domain containing protein [Pyrenophora tritici-repentis]|nr:DUF3328 domain containing protein [Pyrenophora tritici-repentis]